YDRVREYEDRRREDIRGAGVARWERQIDRTRINADSQSYLSATGDFSLVRGLADAAIEDFGLELQPNSEGYAKLCELLNNVRLTALQESQQRALGNVDVEIENKVVRRVRERETTMAKAGETIIELFERWAA